MPRIHIQIKVVESLEGFPHVETFSRHVPSTASQV